MAEPRRKGMIESMFPEYVMPEDGTAGRAVIEGLDSGVRGFQSAGTGMLDLLSVPFSLATGAKHEDLIGTTPYMDKRGLMPPDHPGFLNQSIQLGASMLTPEGVLGLAPAAASKAAQATYSPQTGGRLIPANRGQILGDINLMGDAAKLGGTREFAQRVHEFNKGQNDIAGSVFDGFKRSIAKVDSNDVDLGKRIQGNFDKWFDTVNKNQKARTDRLYEAALKNPDAYELLPKAPEGMKRFEDLVDKFAARGMPSENDALLTKVWTDVSNDMTKPMDAVAMRQKLKEANDLFRVDPMKPGPYDQYSKDLLDMARAAYKGALKDRLKGAADSGSAVAADLMKADEVYGQIAEKMKTFKNQKLNKFLGVETDDMLTPDKVVERFEKLRPAERKFFTAVANKMDPEMAEQVRRHIYDDIFTAGVVVGGPKVESKFSIKQFLTRHDFLEKKNPELLNWVLGDNPEVRKKFAQAIDEAKVAINSGASTPPEKTGMRPVVVGTVAAATGHAGTARLADAGFGILDNIFTNKEALYNHIFKDGPPPPEGLLAKTADTVGRGAKAVAGPVANAGSAVGITKPRLAGAGLWGVSNMAEQDQYSEPATPAPVTALTPSAPVRPSPALTAPAQQGFVLSEEDFATSAPATPSPVSKPANTGFMLSEEDFE